MKFSSFKRLLMAEVWVYGPEPESLDIFKVLGKVVQYARVPDRTCIFEGWCDKSSIKLEQVIISRQGLLQPASSGRTSCSLSFEPFVYIAFPLERQVTVMSRRVRLDRCLAASHCYVFRLLFSLDRIPFDITGFTFLSLSPFMSSSARNYLIIIIIVRMITMMTMMMTTTTTTMMMIHGLLN